LFAWKLGIASGIDVLTCMSAAAAAGLSPQYLGLFYWQQSAAKSTHSYKPCSTSGAGAAFLGPTPKELCLAWATWQCSLGRTVLHFLPAW
jgi:hypothetical protein